MRFALIAVAFSSVLFFGMLGLLDVGRRIGARRLAQEADGAQVRVGVVEGAVFGLLGLLLAFSFSGAAARFDARRQLIVQETNAISTAWLRLDLLPRDAQPGIREEMRRYLDARLSAYQSLPDLALAERELARSLQIKDELWAKAIAVAHTDAGDRGRALVLSALNDMFEIATVRTLATRMHPPFVVFCMLALLAFTGALLAGLGMAGGRTRSWVHMVTFAATIAVAAYVIIDLEFPRVGLIRVDEFDRALVELRNSMN